MKKVIRNIFFYTLFMFFISNVVTSCNSDTKKYYYETGEIGREIILVNKKDNMYYLKEYLKNGQIEQEGYIRDSSRKIREGNWKIYYGDGTLRWDGFFDNDSLLEKIPKDTSDIKNITELSFDISVIYSETFEKDGFIVGNNYKIRVTIPNFHPDNYGLLYEDFQNVPLNTDKDSINYPYEIKIIEPKEGGRFRFWVVFYDKNGVVKFGDPMILVGFKVKGYEPEDKTDALQIISYYKGR